MPGGLSHQCPLRLELLPYDPFARCTLRARSVILAHVAQRQLLRDALSALCVLYPGFRDRVMKEQEQIRLHINIFVGNEDKRYTGGLATQLAAAAIIWILPAVSGGLIDVLD